MEILDLLSENTDLSGENIRRQPIIHKNILTQSLGAL